MIRDLGPARVTFAYALFGAVWILGSDALTSRLITDGASFPLVQTLKGLFYVLLTAGLVFGLARRSTRRIREERSRYRDLYERDERQLAALLAMTRGTLEPAEGDRNTLAAITESAAGAVGVARASIWYFDADRTRLICHDLYEADLRRHSADHWITAAEFPVYCGALAREKVIAANEAHVDDRTREFTVSELVPHGIGAMLDAPIFVDGALAGVLCLQHVGGPRVWTVGEQAFVVSTANLLALMRAKEDLRASETRFREVAENLQDIFYNYDPNRDRLLYANLPFERIWEIRLEEAYTNPMSYFQRIHPDDQAAAWEANRRQRLGETTETEFRVVRPDGSQSWVLNRSASIMAVDGKVERIVGTMRDVTEIRTAQEALAESRRQLSTLLDNLPGTAYRCLLDEAWTMLFISEGITPLTGYLPSDYLSSARLTFSELVHPDDRDRIFKEIVDASACGQTFEVEYRIFSRDGTEKTVWERGRFFPGTEGRTGYLEGFILDITDRKRAEAERQRIEERYRQSQKLEAIGQLAGGVAHDFNNMLTVILVRAEMALRKVQPGDPVHADLREIYDAAQRSAGLARQLLTYARRQSVTTDVLTLGPHVDEALPMLERLVGENIPLKWAAGPELWPVEINASQVDQLLVNLCLNARDAMPYGGVIQMEAHNVLLDEEDCRTRPGLQPGEHVFLSFVDTGTGMEQATIDRLFEPFFTTKEVGKGTGLGLSTVHGIVHQAHGYIEVDSGPGKGSVFRILFPRARDSLRLVDSEGASAKLVRSAVNSDIMNAFPSGNGEVILLIDGDTALRKLAADILSELGYTVLEAESAEAAQSLAEMRSADIRLVMADEKENDSPLAQDLHKLLPTAALLFMSENALTPEESGNDVSLEPQTTKPRIGGRGPLPLIVRKPFATVELALKVRDALAHQAQPLRSAS